MGPVTSPPTLKFGPYLVDLAAGEVRRNGSRIRLQEKPLRVLVLLAERQGQLVTREELKNRLWPDETFVDFESGLNTAVSKLREALSDNADKPRYIETIPRRGYRFVGTVEINGTRSSTAEALGPQIVPAAPRGPDREEVSARTAARSNWKVPVLAGVLVAGAAFAVWWFNPLPPPTVTHTDQVTRSSRIDTPVRPMSVGDHIFYIERDGGHWNLMRTELGAGDGQRVTLPAGNAIPLDVSPDRSKILIGTFEKRGDENQLWTMPADGGVAMRLSGVTASDAKFSPDGLKVAYTHGQSIWIMDADGANPRKLVDLPASAEWLAWSPDGNRLRFTLGSYSGNEMPSIWQIFRNGDGLREVLSDWQRGASKCCGAWTPDGRYYIFSASAGPEHNVWALREGGSWWRRSPRGPFQLTAGPGSVQSGTPGPHGKSILYYSGAWREEVERLDLGTRKFSPLLPNAHALLNSFSRDGQWMAYIDARSASLVRSRSDGTQSVVLAAAEPWHPSFPRWSPDGKWIVFRGGLTDQPAQSFVVPANGGHAEPLLRSQTQTDVRDADWSSDGKKLVISHALEPDDSDFRELEIVDFATRQTEKLPGSNRLVIPRWSPDGHFISAAVDDQSALKLWDFSSKKWTTIARGTALGLSVWSPDRRYLYFQDLLSAGESLQRYDTQTRRVKVVAEFSEILKSGAAHRCALEGITPDGSPIIKFNRGASDLFSAALQLP